MYAEEKKVSTQADLSFIGTSYNHLFAHRTHSTIMAQLISIANHRDVRVPRQRRTVLSSVTSSCHSSPEINQKFIALLLPSYTGGIRKERNRITLFARTAARWNGVALSGLGFLPFFSTPFFSGRGNAGSQRRQYVFT